jgi:RNA polymerase sigma-70 factor (ECF subfamily)
LAPTNQLLKNTLGEPPGLARRDDPAGSPGFATASQKHPAPGSNNMKPATIPLKVLVFALLGPRALTDEITVQTALPVVVRTVPSAGSDQVDPKTTKIEITFSKDMLAGTWSWVRVDGAAFPKVDGKPRYRKNKRTCVLPVKLEAGKTYGLWINTERFGNFKDADGRSAVPYLLVFRTKKKEGGTGPKPKPEPPAFTEANLGRRFDELWTSMDRNYSYFASKKGVDWKALGRRHRPGAVKAKNAREFAAVLRRMLAPLKDLHVWIETPEGVIGTTSRPYRANWNRDATLALLEDRTDCGFAMVANTKRDGFGYFLMVRQSAADEASVRKAVAALGALAGLPGFIVDLRAANGGNEALARALACQFCAKPAVYAKSKFRNGPGHTDFTKPYERILPATDKPFTRPVVCLIGPGSVSSGEGFVQMMKCLPHVTTVGLPTRGASGNPAPFRLAGTGVAVWFSRWVDLMPDSSVFEGKGIAPDVEVNEPAGAYEHRDPTLEEGLKVLRLKIAARGGHE